MSTTPQHTESAPTLATVAERRGLPADRLNALNSPDLLRPDTLARVQAAIEELGYSPNRAARNLRTRASHLVGLRVEPAVEDSANALMDRFVHTLVESTEVAGYHVLLFTAEPDQVGTDPYDEPLRSAAVDAFVMIDSFRGQPAAAWLAGRASRSWRSAGPGTSRRPRHPWVDVDGQAGVAAPDRPPRGSADTPGSPGWAGSAARSFGEDRRSGWVTRCTPADCRRAGSRRAATTPWTSAGGPRTRCSTSRRAERPTALDLRQRHHRDGGAASPRPQRAARRAGRGRGRLRRLDRRAGARPPSLTSVRQPLEQVAVEVVRYLGALLAHRADPAAGLRAHPNPERAREQLASRSGIPATTG